MLNLEIYNTKALTSYMQYIVYVNMMNCLVKKKIKNKLFFKLEILMKKSGVWSTLLLNIYAEI